MTSDHESLLDLCDILASSNLKRRNLSEGFLDYIGPQSQTYGTNITVHGHCYR